MSEVWFYRLALVAPGALGVTLGLASESLLGIALFSLFYFGLPYALFLLGALYWGRDKSAGQWVRWLRLAPLWFCAVFCAYFIVVAVSTSGGGPDDWTTAAKGLGLMAGVLLGLGYLWVLLTLGAWKVVSRRRSARAG